MPQTASAAGRQKYPWAGSCQNRTQLRPG